MTMPLPPGCPPEFDVDTAGAAPVNDAATLNRLHDLLMMRDTLVQVARKAYEVQTKAEEKVQGAQRQTRKMLQTTVGIIDELRRLVADAQRILAQPGEGGVPRGESAPPAQPKPAIAGGGGWFGWLVPWSRGTAPAPKETAPARPSASPAGAGDWLGAFDRLLAFAMNKLEDLKIHHVPLLDQDLKTLAFEGQPVKGWVAIKNQAQDGRLIVKREIRGLWVSGQGKAMEPVLKGEVLV